MEGRRGRADPLELSSFVLFLFCIKRAVEFRLEWRRCDEADEGWQEGEKKIQESRDWEERCGQEGRKLFRTQAVLVEKRIQTVHFRVRDR